MRKIKFRIWNPKEKIMYYQPFELDFIKDGHIELNKWLKNDMCSTKIGCTGKKCMLGVGLVLMQYTGVKDKNKKEIYEGDILFHHKFKSNGKIVYEALSYRVVGNNVDMWLGYCNEKDREVIGNIYENKELLDDKK